MKNTIDTTSDNDLNELDRLVTQEIDALQRNSGKKTRVRKVQKSKTAPSDNVIFRDGWRLKENELTEHEESAPEQHETSMMHELQGDELEHEPAFIEDTQAALESAAELFTEEEQDFIQRSIDWLAARENKDMIISRIWDQLTETVPESFYSVQQQEESDSGSENLLDTDPQVLDNTDTTPTDPST